MLVHSVAVVLTWNPSCSQVVVSGPRQNKP